MKHLCKAGDILLPLLVLFFIIFLSLRDASIVTSLQNAVFDQYNRWYPRQVENSPIVHIDIDEASLQKLGQFPWPRNLFADLIENAAAYGATTIAFDILFSEPDRNSPEAILPIWKNLNTSISSTDWAAMSEAMRRNIIDPDDRLAEALSRTPSIVAVMMNNQGDNLPNPKTSFALRKQGGNLGIAGIDPLLNVFGSSNAITNHGPIQIAAKGMGSINARVDDDGIIRRTSLIVRGGETLYPSLSLEALRVAQGARSIILKASDVQGEASYTSGLGLSRLKIGKFIVPIEPDGSVRLYYARSASIERIPAWEILAPNFDSNRLMGRIAFIGTSAAGLKDLRATPLNPVASGVEIHVQTAQQIIDGVYLRRPLWLQTLEPVGSLIVGLLIILMVYRLGLVSGGILLLISGSAATGLSLWSYQTHLLLLDPTVPFLTVAASYLTASLLHYLRIEAERDGVRSAFGQYLSPELVEQIAKEPSKLTLGGEVKPITVMFSDIRGFTALSEALKDEPQVLTYVINRFLTVMSQSIQNEKGTIDKYIGDCIMAFWNAPTDVPQHALNACRAALDMTAKLDALNEDLRHDPEVQGLWGGDLKIGIGLNTGGCLVGNVGSDQRFNYSVMGDTVNIASRLEGQTKNYGIITLVGQQTYQRAAEEDEGLVFAELDLISLKGKDAPEHIYALLGYNTDDTPEQTQSMKQALQEHAAFINAYRAQNWKRASTLANKLGADLPMLQDCYVLYRERITYFETTPPDDDWDGVFRVTSK